MRSLAASTRAQVIGCSLLVGILALAPGLAFAQTTPPINPQSGSGADTDMVARCDLPVLDLFNPSPGDLVLPGAYMVSGVALDPLASDGSGIDQVSVYLGARDQGGTQLGSVTPSGGPRQESFSVSVDLPNVDPGTEQQLVAYAHSASGDRTTELSVPILIGRDTSHPALANPFLNTINTNPGVVPTNCSGSTAVAVPNVLNGGAPGATQVNNVAANLFGTVIGSVSNCTNGAEQPAPLVVVQADGTNSSAQTTEDGEFQLTDVPAPGKYTISVSDNGNSASRLYVPVAPGETIDVGTLELGANPTMGCGDEDQAP
jgi:hypothetical protein